MAYLGFSPPEPFDFQRPDDWMMWKRHFECFRLASGLAKEDEARQVSALLYCMGDQADSGPTQGQVVSTGDTPRSYVVDTPTGTVQRNRVHLRVIPGSPERPSTEEPTRRIMTRHQTGTVIRPPERLTL